MALLTQLQPAGDYAVDRPAGGGAARARHLVRDGARLQHGDAARRSSRGRDRVGDGQHREPGRRLVRHGASEHRRGERGGWLRGIRGAAFVHGFSVATALGVGILVVAAHGRRVPDQRRSATRPIASVEPQTLLTAGRSARYSTH